MQQRAGQGLQVLNRGPFGERVEFHSAKRNPAALQFGHDRGGMGARTHEYSHASGQRSLNQPSHFFGFLLLGVVEVRVNGNLGGRGGCAPWLRRAVGDGAERGIFGRGKDRGESGVHPIDNAGA